MKIRFVSAILSVLIFCLPVLTLAADISAEIRKFDLAMMKQYAASDWQTDPNSSANIIEKDRQQMESGWKNSSGGEGGDYGSGGSSGDIDIGDALLVTGIAVVILGVIALPFILLSN